MSAAPRLAAAFLACAALACGGCLQRRIQITSEPPGALVWVNDVEIGRTPAETSFTFFGAYDVRLRLDGYEPVTTSRRARAPFYEYPPIDLAAAAAPADIETIIHWHFDLVPLAAEPDREAAEAALVDRAAEFRGRVESSPAAN